MELRNEITVRGVDLDTVETRLACPHGGRGVRRDRRIDALLGHFLWGDGFEGRLVNRMRDRRRSNRRLAADVAAGMSAAVAELNRRLRSGAVNFIDQVDEPRQKAVVVDPDLAATMSAGFLRRRHLDGDE